MKKVVFLSALVLLVATAIGAALTNATGKWEGTIAMLYDVKLDMKEDKGKFNGTVTTEIGDIPLKDGVQTGNEVVFKKFTYNGFAVNSVKGKINGDKMDVTVNFQNLNFTGTLNRVK